MDIPRMLSWIYIVCFFKEGLFVYFWLPQVLLAARRLFVVEAGKVPLHCGGRASRCWRLLAEKLGLQGPQSPECRLSSCGTWLSCSMAREIFQDQGLNQCPLRCKADS